MTDAEVEAKFRQMVVPRYNADMAKGMLEMMWKFEGLDSVTALIRQFDNPKV